MGLFAKNNKSKVKKGAANKYLLDYGLVLFDTVQDAIEAEKIIKNNGAHCRLIAPPPEQRRGCDLALEITLIEQMAIANMLADKVPFVDILPFNSSSELLDIIKTYYYDDHIMVKAGNMKLTFEKTSGIIVNTSGGGCPDIPYLNIKLVGNHLLDIPRPKDIGRTLCALMLDRAVEGAIEIWEEGNKACS